MNEKEFNRDEYISECYATPAHNVRRPHKHAELIKAWADGAEIEIKHRLGSWESMQTKGEWIEDYEYRIKPEPKPDVRLFTYVGRYEGDLTEVEIVHKLPNLILWFDGETGELKSAEVLK